MNRINIIFNIIISILVYLLGFIDNLLITLFIFIIIDYITGLCKGIYDHKLSSKVSIKGIIKKFGYIVIVVISTLFDRLTNDSSFAIRTIIIYFFIANEALSIIENWAYMGLPLPKKLYDVFNKLKDE